VLLVTAPWQGLTAFSKADPSVVWRSRHPELLAAMANTGCLVQLLPWGWFVALNLTEDAYLGVSRSCKTCPADASAVESVWKSIF